MSMITENEGVVTSDVCFIRRSRSRVDEPRQKVNGILPAISPADTFILPKLIESSNISITSTPAVMNPGDFQRIVLQVSKRVGQAF